jgi:very-short-patch-repair endonuclease
LQKKQSNFTEQSHQLREILGDSWRGEDSDFQWLSNVIDWHKEFQSLEVPIKNAALKAILTEAVAPNPWAPPQKNELDSLKSELKNILSKLKLKVDHRFGAKALEVDLQEYQELSKSIAEHSGRYDQWRDYCRLHTLFAKHSLRSLLKRIEKGELSPEDAETELQYARAEAQWRICTSDLPKLAELQDISRHDLVQAFRELETKRIVEIREAVRLKHLDQVPRGAVGEMQYIRGELARKRGHKSIRKLMENAGSMLQRIKPALLMSPISVAQFLPPGSITFDLLVIDEASQVRPEDSLGAIVRARQIVVVGDQKQLPPTSFFDRVSQPDDQDDAEDSSNAEQAARATELESILTLCEARGLRQEMLEWHYRSRDPSLIKVSNSEFYDHRLILPPSPLERDESYGLKLTRVPGVYARQGTEAGRPRTNRIEAQSVVKRVAEHARETPDLSLGVVTFSVAQRSMVEELLEFERRKDKALDQFLREGRNEDFFVKNIENVQGDERDVILISVCYGPLEPNGRLASMSFGPVNSEGGERRLNVLFSRARIRCEVFISFDPRDIDLSRTQKEGPRVLKRFLEFAQTGQLDEKVPTGFLADSPFEEDVADVIRRLGYDLDHQVGSGGFLIDIGVKNPKHVGQYLMAVECDGATYHSALWARERDRLRQSVLEHLGWKFHRIWSTDWFHRREREIERLKQALEGATQESEQGISVSGANEFDPIPEVDEADASWEQEIQLETPQLKGEPYVRFDQVLKTTQEPHEVSTASIANIIDAVIRLEGPVHQDEISRRVASAFGKERAGNRIVDATQKGLKYLKGKDTDILSQDGFWMTQEQLASPIVRDRSEETGLTLKGPMIPPIEIRAARAKIIAESGAVDEEDLVKAIAYMLGFKRAGPDLKNSILSGLKDG